MGKWGESGGRVVTADAWGASDVQDATRVRARRCRERHPVSDGVVTEVVFVRRGSKRRTRAWLLVDGWIGRFTRGPLGDGWRLRAVGVAHTIRRVACRFNFGLWKGS
ncbi:hypothetical protein GCM10022207_31360 [Streptomyces lannensis]|uniref:Transposase n=1 Tax=Streptomyces lannensis TaxID=766498 RepID=A0ABP7K6B8_9ACTN